MADDASSTEIYAVEPIMRGIIPIHSYKPSKSLRREINKGDYEICFNTCFRTVMEMCANRDETWINAQILDLYCTLFSDGFAHSVEIFDGENLVGGLYGVSIKRAFFGESMFSTKKNTSKLALYYLVERLKERGFSLLDTQFITPHLKSMGGVEISQKEYLKLLKAAID